jgi:hypothetical protein
MRVGRTASFQVSAHDLENSQEITRKINMLQRLVASGMTHGVQANHGRARPVQGGPSHTTLIKASKRRIALGRFDRKLCPLPGNIS